MEKAEIVPHDQTQQVASSGHRITDRRLSPAEAHEILRQHLEHFAASSGLGPAGASCTITRTIIQTYNPGEIVLPAGVRGECLGLLVEGEAEVRADRQGNSRRVAILLPGRAFGHEMMEGYPSYATLQALSHCEVWFVRRADVKFVRPTDIRPETREWQADVGPGPEAAKRSAKRRANRRTTPVWYRVSRAALWLAVALAVGLTLGLPSTRQAWAQVPMGLGQWCSQEGHVGCAERAWIVAGILASSDANPRLALGTLYVEQGQLEAAERNFAAAEVLAPNSPEVRNNLGVIYARRGEHERALAAFRQARDIDPGIPAIEHNLGSSLQALHAYDEALAHYQSALALGAPQADTLANMASAYYEAGELQKAEETAQEALRYDEARVSAYTVLGAVALELQQPDEALSHLRRVVALDSQNGPALFYLGLTYEALDKPTFAIAALEQALDATVDGELSIRIRHYLNELQELVEADK
jgi:tetratricopeptide (TPR) repeat protein